MQVDTAQKNQTFPLAITTFKGEFQKHFSLLNFTLTELSDRRIKPKWVLLKIPYMFKLTNDIVSM